MIISGGAMGADMSYPSTPGRKGGTLPNVWDEVMRGAKPAVLRQARWKLKG